MNLSDTNSSGRTSGVDYIHIVGASDQGEARKWAEQYFKNLFENQEFDAAHETKKPGAHAAVLDAILAKLPEFVRAFGGVPLALRPEHFHFYDDEKAPDGIGKDELNRGAYQPSKQSAYVLWQHMKNSLLKLVHTIAHEAMHFNSFGACTTTHEATAQGEEDVSIRIAAAGLMRREGDFFLFLDLNEAVTEELVKRFDRLIRDIPELQEEIQLREQRKRDVLAKNPADLADEIDAISREVVDMPEYTATSTRLEVYSYYSERMKLREIMQAILMRNRDSFSSLDDVFAVFAKAYFTGDTSELARIVDSAYGPGGFDRLGKETGRNAAEGDLR